MNEDINYKNSIISIHSKNNQNIFTTKSIDKNFTTEPNDRRVYFKVLKTINTKKVENKKLSSGCCSVVLQGKNNSYAYAYRRDSSYAADLYIKKTKLHGKEALIEYKLRNGYFFHTLVLTDGWFVGSGGADIPRLNRFLENLGAKIASKGKITNNDMRTAQGALRGLGIGHFIVKSPEGNVGVAIYNGGRTRTTVFKMKEGEYVSVPNSPSHYRRGAYTVQKSNLVDAAIHIASTDRWGVNRRNIITYDVKKIANSINVKIWASYDNGKNIGRGSRGRPDNIIYKKITTRANSIPTIPNKKYIGEAILKLC